MREAVAHQHTQLLEAKAIIKQQGKELRDKDGEFEALKERLTGVHKVKTKTGRLHSDFQGALLLFRAGPHIFSAYKIVLNLSLF